MAVSKTRLVVVLTEDEAGWVSSLGYNLGLRRASQGILQLSAFKDIFWTTWQCDTRSNGSENKHDG